MILGCFKAVRPEAGLSCKPEALIRALDFFNLDTGCWPLGLRVLHITAELRAEAERSAAWRAHVSDAAARLFFQLEKAVLTATFAQQHDVCETRAVQAGGIEVQVQVWIETVHPHALSLRAAKKKSSPAGRELLAVPRFRDGEFAGQPSRPSAWAQLPEAERSVFGALASRCRAEHLCLTTGDDVLTVTVAGVET